MSTPRSAEAVARASIESVRLGRARKGWVVLGLLIIAGLLYLAFRGAPLADIWVALRRLQGWQIVVLLVTDLTIYLLVTARWWLIIRAHNKLVPYFPLLPVRLAVFGISYFTVGPQVGGEALQVLFLRRQHGLTYARATASVIMDKLLELLANFFLLLFGLTAVGRLGALSGPAHAASLGLVLLTALAAWPVIHLLLLARGYYPISSLLSSLHRMGRLPNFARFLRAAEHLAGQFCQRHPRSLAAGVVVSVTAAVGTLIEYSLLLNFLHIGLPFWQTVSAWTVSWLSFLIPLPGGLGALEAGQVFTLALFGISAASALGVTFLMRGRDMLIGAVGLLLVGNAARRPRNPRNPN